MKGNIKRIVEEYSDKTAILNQVIVHQFVQANHLPDPSGYLKQFIEKKVDIPVENCIETLEDVITVFEQAIPKNERTTNGAIYTPQFIRDYIVTNTLSSISKRSKSLRKCLLADISCGCGAFLFSAAEYIYSKSERSYTSIIHQLYGFDISSLSIERAKIVLALASALHGEYPNDSDFRLYCRDSLSLKICEYKEIESNKGFDIIVGNPPYVRAKHLSDDIKKTMRIWDVAKVGNPDLYIPFFEVGLSLLKTTGVLGYITVNSFFKSVNARALRKYFHMNQFSLRIINFGEERIFKGVLAYTCIVFIEKHQNKNVLYIRTDSSYIKNNTSLSFTSIPYIELQDFSGWHLNKTDVLDKIRIIEGTGSPLSSLFQIKNGIATLANDVYIFKPVREDQKYFYLKRNDEVFKIEKSICRSIIKPNVIKTEEEIAENTEKIIFPYAHDYVLLQESAFRRDYPQAYSYLLSVKNTLLERDKGGAKDYPAWFAFGRTQAISDVGMRLLFPYMTDSPHFVLCEDPNILIYCGYGIYSDSLLELRSLKRILESKVFDYYIRNTSKPYSTGYYSYAKNYVKSFGLPKLSNEQKEQLSNMTDTREIDDFVCNLYGITI